MNENKPFQGTAAIVGAISGFLAAISSLMTMINTSKKPAPTIQINVDPSINTPVQRSSTLQNLLELNEEVEKTSRTEKSSVKEKY